MSRTSRSMCVIGALLLAGSACAAWPTVIFSNIATSPTSDVPGLAGVKFNPGTSTQFDRPFQSPSGAFWMFGASTNLPGTENEVIIVGGGLNGAGSGVKIREGTPTFFDAGLNWGFIRTQMGINDAGQFAFSADTSAATATDEVVARFNGNDYELMAREGTQAPGQAPGIGYGGTSNAVHILANGDTRFRTGGLTGATSQYVLYNNSSISTGAIVGQTDVTVPAGQFIAPDQSIDLFTSDRFRSDADGSHYLYHADLNGTTTTDVVMVHNGTVAAQEGVVLPGSGFAAAVALISGDAGSQQISPYNDHYMFRGNNADGSGATSTDWVYGDGAVRAATDQPIFPGATELYDDAIFSTTFFLNTINSNGDYIIGGVTNAANIDANAVLVYNGLVVLMREGDPVDVDGDGLFDDDAYVSVFNNDDSFLTDDGYYYFNADLRNGAGESIGQAFMVAYVPEPAALGLALLALAALRRP